MHRIITASATASVVSLILDNVDGLEVNEVIRVYGTANNKIDGRHTIASITVATKTITYSSPSSGNIVAFNPANAGLVELTTWCDTADVESFLGFTAAGADLTFLEEVTEAGNDWCYLRRKKAGYVDSRTIIPAMSVKQGTVLYCAALYRERGSIDSFQSFGDQVIPGNVGTMSQIKKLLGVDRAQVA